MTKKESLALENECLENILSKFVAKHTRFQTSMTYSVSNIEGAIRLAFLRGIQVGKDKRT